MRVPDILCNAIAEIDNTLARDSRTYINHRTEIKKLAASMEKLRVELVKAYPEVRFYRIDELPGDDPWSDTIEP